MAETIRLRDGGTLYYDPTFYAPGEADALFDELRRTVVWEQQVSRGRPFPRLTAWCADVGVDYRYSGVVHAGAGWAPALLDVRRRVEAASGAAFNSVLLNRYRDGRDSIGMHSDDEPELGGDPVVASVSLGGVRTFVLRHKESRERLALELGHGGLLVMGGTCQRHWLHGVPKTEAAVGERINLTFRRVYV